MVIAEAAAARIAGTLASARGVRSADRFVAISRDDRPRFGNEPIRRSEPRAALARVPAIRAAAASAMTIARVEGVPPTQRYPMLPAAVRSSSAWVSV